MELDESTERFLELAYLVHRQNHKRGKPSVGAMRKLMGKQWADTRLNVISTWAEGIQASVCGERLVGKVELVFGLLREQGIDWEWPWDEDEAVHTAAWGLATLRWICRAAAGRCPPRPECADDEIEDWLEAKETKQLSLW